MGHRTGCLRVAVVVLSQVLPIRMRSTIPTDIKHTAQLGSCWLHRTSSANFEMQHILSSGGGTGPRGYKPGKAEDRLKIISSVTGDIQL